MKARRSREIMCDRNLMHGLCKYALTDSVIFIEALFISRNGAPPFHCILPPTCGVLFHKRLTQVGQMLGCTPTSTSAELTYDFTVSLVILHNGVESDSSLITAVKDSCQRTAGEVAVSGFDVATCRACPKPSFGIKVRLSPRDTRPLPRLSHGAHLHSEHTPGTKSANISCWEVTDRLFCLGGPVLGRFRGGSSPLATRGSRQGQSNNSPAARQNVSLPLPARDGDGTADNGHPAGEQYGCRRRPGRYNGPTL